MLDGWIDKMLHQSFSKQNIIFEFKATIIWILNPWTMDDNTLPSEVHTSTNNMEDEEDYIFDDEANDSQQWGDNLLPHN